MKKYIIVILLLEACFGQMALNPKFWKSDHIVLSKEEKIENIGVGEEVVLGYQDSIEHTVIGKIIAVNDKEIKIKQTDNKKISIINLKDITFIEIEIIHSGCYNGALLGGLLSGGYIAMIGDWSSASDMYVGMIITPIVAVFGAGFGGLIGSLSDSVVLKKYIIGEGEWNFVISKSG
jgi:hypothetical protein|tara:strand:+ start:73 stop:603 length:531 start_codon:yes stop_codon:yes gene_type:complete